MRKAKTKSSAALLRHVRRKHLLIIGAFVLVFVGFGSTFVYRSEAASCIAVTLRQGSSGWCVSVLQDSLQMMSNHYGGENVAWPGRADGLFGYNTYQSVRTFQSTTRIPVTGIVYAYQGGGTTWPELCSDLHYIHNIFVQGGSKYQYQRNEAYTDYQWLGCSTPYGNFTE